jgi:hypothetical protein
VCGGGGGSAGERVDVLGVRNPSPLLMLRVGEEVAQSRGERETRGADLVDEAAWTVAVLAVVDRHVGNEITKVLFPADGIVAGRISEYV